MKRQETRFSYVYEDLKKRNNKKAIRKNVTIPAWLNELAEEKNVNFSNVLQNALMKKLNI